MTSPRFLLTVPPESCRGLFALKHPDAPLDLDQYLRRQLFFQKNNCSDIGDEQGQMSHEAITITVNQGPIDLCDLCQQVLYHSSRARRWLWIDINKFYVYTSQPIIVTESTQHQDDFDRKLVDYIVRLLSINFLLITSCTRPDDRGNLGNFIHPVTNLVFERNGQA